MSGRKSGLGRGLGHLISKDAARSGAGRAVVTHAPVDAIEVNPEQPRKRFVEGDLAELRTSIRRHGVLSPLLVRQEGRRYVLIAGERRLRAAKAEGLREVPVVVRAGADDAATQLELALVENLQRADLDPIEAALGYQRLIDAFGHTQEQVAAAVGKERPTIANAVRLLRLPQPVLDAVRAGELSAGHARALLPLAEHPSLHEAVAYVRSGKLSVRATEGLVRQVLAGSNLAEQQSARQQRAAIAAPVAARLTASLAAKVQVRPRKKGGGRIVIEYSDAAELERLVGKIDS